MADFAEKIFVKLSLFLSVFLIIHSVSAGNKDNLRQTHDFNHLTISHLYGDEYYVVEEMTFTKKGSKIYGSISSPDNNALEDSKTELGKNDVDLIVRFLTMAKKFEEDCPKGLHGTYLNYYHLKIDGNEINIQKFCDWGDLTYTNVKKQIFGDYLDNLDRRREQLNREKGKLLNGFWKYDFSIHKIEKGRIYTLKKMENKSKKECYLYFGERQNMIDHNCLKKGKTHYNFDFDIVNGDLLLSFNGINTNRRKDFVYSYVYKVIELDTNKLKLTPR